MLAFWHRRNRLLVGTRSGHIVVFDAATATFLEQADAAVNDPISCLFVSEETESLFVGTKLGVTLRLNLSSLDIEDELDGDGGNGHTKSVIAFTCTDNFLFSAGADGTIHAWRLDTNSFCFKFYVDAPVTSLLAVGKWLWAGDCRGCINVLDIYGEKDTENVSIVFKQRAHQGAVMHLVLVGSAELWSAPSAFPDYDIYDISPVDMHLPQVEEPAVEESIAVWDIIDCRELRREAHLPEGGLCALFVRQHHVFERSLVTVVDHMLDSRDVIIETMGGPDTQPPNYQGVLIATLESELKRLKGQLDENQSMSSCICDSYFNRHPSAAIPNQTLFPNQINNPLSVSDTSEKHVPFGVHDNLLHHLKSAQAGLVPLLSTNPSSQCTQKENDETGIVSASENIQAAVTLLDRFESSVAMRSEIENGLDCSSNSNGSSAHRRKYHTNVDLMEEMDALVLERDTLLRDLRQHATDSMKTINGLEDLVKIYEQEKRDLMAQVVKASFDVKAFEVMEKRCVELEVLSKHQIEQTAQSLLSMEPRLETHISSAFQHMATDQSEIQRLQSANTGMDSELSVYREQIALLEDDNNCQRGYVTTLTNNLVQMELEQNQAEKVMSQLKSAAILHEKELLATKSANSNYTGALAALKDEMSEKERELQASRASESDLRTKLRSLTAQQIEQDLLHKKRLGAVQASLSICEEQVSKLSRQLDESSTDNGALRAEVENLNTVISELKQIGIRTDIDPTREKECDTQAGDSSSGDTTAKTSTAEITSSRNDKELREALEAAAESTRCTQEVVKELASTANAYKKAASYHVQSQAAIYAILKRVRQLSKRKTVNGTTLAPVVDALLQTMYINPEGHRRVDEDADKANGVSPSLS